MEKEMQEQLVGIVEKFSNGVSELGKAKDFAVEQAPDVVQQLLMWNMVESLVVNAMVVMFCIGLGLVIKRLITVSVTL